MDMNMEGISHHFGKISSYFLLSETQNLKEFLKITYSNLKLAPRAPGDCSDRTPWAHPNESLIYC